MSGFCKIWKMITCAQQIWGCGYCQSICSLLILMPCLSLSSRSCLPHQPDVLQPGCVWPAPDAVSSTASHTTITTKRSTCSDGLSFPAGIQPKLHCTTTLDRIVDHGDSISATFNLLQHFRTWQSWKWITLNKDGWVIIEHLDSCVLVVMYENYNWCIASVLLEELPNDNVDTSWLVLHEHTVYKWQVFFFFLTVSLWLHFCHLGEFNIKPLSLIFKEWMK